MAGCPTSFHTAISGNECVGITSAEEHEMEDDKIAAATLLKEKKCSCTTHPSKVAKTIQPHPYRTTCAARAGVGHTVLHISRRQDSIHKKGWEHYEFSNLGCFVETVGFQKSWKGFWVGFRYSTMTPAVILSPFSLL